LVQGDNQAVWVTPKEASSFIASLVDSKQMGWFDDGDEEENESDTRRSPQLLSLNALHEDHILPANTAVAHQSGNEDEDNVDPLDAYMNSLETQEMGMAVFENHTKISRMDLDSAEEATGHWEETRQTHVLETQHNLLASSEVDGRQRDSFDALPEIEIQHSTAPFAKALLDPTSTDAGKAWRRAQNVACSALVDPLLHFSQFDAVFNNSATLSLAIASAGYSEPTLVQAQTIPVIMAGRDVLVTAATGQGKTLAFIWPILCHIIRQEPLLPHDETGPMALVLVPTRELATQVSNQAKPFAKALRLRVKTVIGGQGKYLLQQELHKMGGVELVVATPGRLLDVVTGKKGLRLSRVTMIVLDEADKMLHMGFEAQVRKILAHVRPDRQTLLFSATLGRRVEVVAREWLHVDYVRIAVGRTGEASSHVAQHVIVLPNDSAKIQFLLELLPTLQQVGRTLVFVARREACEVLAKRVREQLPKINVETLHVDKHQSDRQAALRAFTKGDVDVLIGTDVAGRGLDIPHVATVLSMDPAKNLDAHVHRVGRAGRLSKDSQQTGSAYTLLTAKDSAFAFVLRKSFERENREITPELDQLSRQSCKTGSGVYEHHKRDDAPPRFGGNWDADGVAANLDEVEPPSATKRGRWS
jgi:ATP-dependent RNA helicase DDX42